MSNTFRVARIAALSLILAAPIGPFAFAQGTTNYGAGESTAFGSLQQHQVVAAAQVPAMAVPMNTQRLSSEFNVGENTTFGTVAASKATGPAQSFGYSIASNAPVAGTSNLVGNPGSQQQHLAMIIYQPGSRAAGW